MARPPRLLAALALSSSRAAGAQGPRVVSSEETEAFVAVLPGARVHDPFAQRRRCRHQGRAPDPPVRVSAVGFYVWVRRALREVYLSGAVIIAYR